jgi:hypothetical protein
MLKNHHPCEMLLNCFHVGNTVHVHTHNSLAVTHPFSKKQDFEASLLWFFEFLKAASILVL